MSITSTEAELRTECDRIAARSSLYWDRDHPNPSRLDRRSPPPSQTNADMLASCRGNLRDAQRDLVESQRRAYGWEQIGDQVAHANRQELQSLLPNFVRRHLVADIRRAKAEIMHWQDYADRFEKRDPLEVVELRKLGYIEGLANRLRVDESPSREPGADDDSP